jgi:two-component system, chemotaxis family, protein-glutamate methylesterase/glutaminase
MGTRDIVVIGTSLGGIEALKTLVAAFPQDLKAAIFVVVHIAPSSPGVLPSILQRAGPLSASNSHDGEPIRHGHIFVAPPDHHLLIDPHGRVRISRGPRENLWRPAVDPLFRSAAAAYGSRVIGVILTGGLDDGAAGLWTVKQRGGTAVVQHPDDAVAPSMPLSAMLRVAVDHCVPLVDLGPLLVRLVREPTKPEEPPPMPDQLQTENKIAAGEEASLREKTQLGTPSHFGCPECHGVLSEINEGGHSRFRCHAGHAYSSETLLSQFGTDAENSLWNAIRSLEEKAILLRKNAHDLNDCDAKSSERCLREAAELESQANALRTMVLSRKRGAP